MNAILPFPPGNAAYADWVENSMKLKLKINIVIKINAKEFRALEVRKNLIKYIEAKPARVEKLQHITGRCWAMIKKACELGRLL